MLTLLVNQGAIDIRLKKPDYAEFKTFIKETDYIIHESMVKMIYEGVGGNYNLAEEVLNELEKNGYIVEKTFIRNVDSSELEKIRKLILDIRSKELKKPKLDENERILLFILKNVNEINKNDLMKISGIENFNDALKKLHRFKIISIYGNRIILKRRISLTIENEREIYSRIAKWYESKKMFEDAGKFYYLSGNLKKVSKFICNNKSININLQYAKYCYNISINPVFAEKLVKYFETNEMYEEMYSLSKRLYQAYPDKLKYLSLFANASFLLNDYRTSRQLYKKLLKSSKKSTYRLDSLIGLAKIYYKKEDLKNALDMALQALKIAIKKENRLREADIYKIIGNIYYYNFNDISAKSYYERSLLIYKELNAEKEIANIYNNLANIYSEMDIKKSFDYYSKAMELSEKNWWISLIIALNINLGILHIYLGNLNNAIYNERRSLGLSLAKKDYSSAILALIYIFEIQMLVGRYNEAEETVDLGLKLSKKSSAQITHKTFIMDRKILNILKGRAEKIIGSEKFFPDDIPLHSELAKYYASQLKLYEGDINGYIEDFRKNFVRQDRSIKIGDLLDLMNYLELILYRNYFSNEYPDEIKNLVERVRGIRDLENLNLIRWRMDIIYATLSIEEKNTRKIFYENIKKIENEGLMYLGAKLKIVYGLYFFKKTGEKYILNEGLTELKSFKMPGLLNIYGDAIRMFS